MFDIIDPRPELVIKVVDYYQNEVLTHELSLNDDIIRNYSK